MNSFEEWLEAVLDELLRRALEEHPDAHQDLLRTVLEAQVRPALEAERAYVFFHLGSGAAGLEPVRFVETLLEEASKREARGREPTGRVPVWGDPDYSHPASLPGLAHTIIEDIIELDEDDLEVIYPRK